MTRVPTRAPMRAPAPPGPPPATLADQATQELLRPLPTASGAAFESMLLAKYRDRDLQVRRVPIPDAIKQVSYVWIREQDSNDEVTAATWADSIMTAVQRRSSRLINQIEQREAKRLSICAIWRRGHAAPEEVNGEIPLMEINKWSTKFWGVLEIHYMDLNGIPAEDVQKSLEGAVILGAPPPPEPSASGPREEGEASEGE